MSPLILIIGYHPEDNYMLLIPLRNSRINRKRKSIQTNKSFGKLCVRKLYWKRYSGGMKYNITEEDYKNYICLAMLLDNASIGGLIRSVAYSIVNPL